jgi:Ca2+-binding RTX toxin-like protein
MNENAIYFIDSRVSDIFEFTSQLPSGADWHLINKFENGLFKIQSILASRDQLDVIHIISHGSPGAIFLGDGFINASNINDFEYELGLIGQSLKSTGDIFIYGCDVGSDEIGRQFIQRIAELTLADVAASNDKTGPGLEHGNWTLEATNGVIEAQSMKIEDYEHLLTIPGSIIPSESGLLIEGDESSNRLIGTVYDDTLLGYGSDDELDGSFGHDILDGGDGGDDLKGGAGNDTISGGAGADRLEGDLGNDLLFGFTSGTALDDVSGDELFGGRGDDTLIGSRGNDLLIGNEGSDDLSGGAGNDTIIGGLEGAQEFDIDTIQGGAGDDQISIYLGVANGGDGNDVIKSWQGLPEISGLRPTLTGGAGSDIFELGAWADSILENRQIWPWTSQDAPVITDFVAGTGGDRLDVNGFLNYSASNGGYTGGNPFSVAQLYFQLIALPSDALLQWDPDGSDGPQDWVTVATLVNVLASNVIKENFQPMMDPTGEMDDGLLLQGTIGNDSLSGAFMNDTLHGNSGNDELAGQYGDDQIWGDAGDDLLLGGGGNDTLIGGSGSNKLHGELGNDYLIAANEPLSADALQIGNSELFGGDGNDTLRGSTGNDTLWGGTGSDLLLGGDGHDHLIGWVDHWEVWSFPEGIDTLQGGGGNDILALYNGVADGGTGDDYIRVWNGNNRVDSQVTLTGGTGKDVFVIDLAAETLETDSRLARWFSEYAPIITDFETGITKDQLDITGFIDLSAFYGYAEGNPFDATLGYFQLSSQSSNTLVQWDRDGKLSGHDFVTIAQLNNVLPGQLSAASFTIDMPPDGTNYAPINFSGTASADSLTGGFLSDTLRGSSGEDMLDGSYGHDLIYGDDGNDDLYGSFGNDTLIGGLGQDNLNGGYGNDLLIAASSSADEFTYGNTLNGGSGNDTLQGSQGDDSLDGGWGDDLLTGGAGRDTLIGGGDIAWYPHGTDILSGGDGDDNLALWSGSADAGDGADRLALWQGIYSWLDSTSFKAVTVSGGAGADVFALENGEANTWIADNKAWFSLNAPIITDFETEGTHDKINVNSFLYTSAVDGGYTGGNPFNPALNYLKLTQDGSNTLLQWDRDGTQNSHEFVNIAVLKGVNSSSIGTEHFEGVNLVGTDGNDLLIGTPFNDTLQGGLGNDTLKGEGGTDDAVYAGQSADYSVVQIGPGQFTVTDSVSGRDGSDILYDMEYLKFSDRRYPLPAPEDKPPSISVTANDTELEPGQTSVLTFTLSEPSLDFTALDVGVSGGIISNFSGSGTQYQATFTPNALATSGAVFVDSERFQDLTGNWNQDGGDQDNVVTLLLNQDLTPPTIALSANKSNLVGGESITINFTLSEVSTDFTLQDIGVTGGTLSNFMGSGKNYQATFTASKTVTSAGVFVDSERFTDASGLWNQDGGDLNNVVTFNVQPDITPPTIALSSNKSVLNNGESANITFTLSEAVSGFVASDVTAKGGTLSNFQGSGTSYSATFTANATATSGGVYVPSNKFTDLSGNLNKDGLESNNIATMMIRNGGVIKPDPVSPTIAITCNKAALKTGETATITFTLSEGSTDFIKDDITVTGGSLGNLVLSTSNPLVYTATFTPTAGATAAKISVDSSKFTDAAGNANQDGTDANNAVSMTIGNGSSSNDTTPSTIIVSCDKTSLSKGQTAMINFSLSEPSTDFTLADVTVVGGTLSNFQGSGTSYTATFTPSPGATTAAVLVSSNTFRDAAGNYNQDGTEANNAVSMTISNTPVDTTPPTIIVGSDKFTLSNTQTAAVSFTLSEASTDFALSDVTVIGGTLSNFQGSGVNYTATFTPTAGATSAAIQVSSDKFSDAAGNLNKDGSDTNNAVSLTINNTPVDTTPPTIIVGSDKTTLSSTQTATLTFTLSEPSTDFSISDVVVLGGSLSNFQGSGTSYTATFTPLPSSTSALAWVSSDAFGDATGHYNNDGDDANNAISLTISSAFVDPMPPTIAINSDKTTLTNAQTAIISFNLSEPSNNFTSEDVSVVGGTLSNFQGSGTSYTATFTPNPGAVSAALFVTSGTFADPSGNVNLDGSDVNNALSFSIQSAVVQTTSLSSAPVPSLLSMQLDDPVDTFSINLSDVLLSGTTIGSTQTMLKIEGDANDVVNLSNLLDSGQNTGAWQANMSIQLDQNSYKYWTHSGNQNAVLLIEDSIQTVNLM